MHINPNAGKVADPSILVDIPKLIKAYYDEIPDPSVKEQRVVFGTSGHRGTPFKNSFNEHHILAITQAICLYREKMGIDGPLFIGIDTHALSQPALNSAMEVLGANEVKVMISENDGYTPTPVISHSILKHNRGRKSHFADGIVITPSHNPPHEGGFKYNDVKGGPADPTITDWVQAKANELLEKGLEGVKRIAVEKSIAKAERYNYIESYVGDLDQVIDMEVIKGIKLGVDPLGGAGVYYWEPIAHKYGLDLTVVSTEVDPTFSFMTLDWDGQIRMDPSSPYAMQRLLALKDRFDIAFACDTDHDRHGIVTKSSGLLPPNHYLSAAVYYLFQHRPDWKADAAIGKTLVSSQMFDKVAAKLGRKLYEVPVGFKWFVDGLFDGSLGFGGEESAGASFLRMDGQPWSTDKDGMIAALLSAEMTAKMGKDPGEIYADLAKEFGQSFYKVVSGPANAAQKASLKKLKPEINELGGEKVEAILTSAPGNGAPIGGFKVVAKSGWIALRPSGTEDIYKLYGESFKSKAHLDQLLKEGEQICKTIKS